MHVDMLKGVSIMDDYKTLGEAAAILELPTSTLRSWTDELEKYEVHFVLRNNRKERLYTEEDLSIFRYMRDIKNEYQRRLINRDVASLIKRKAEEEHMFSLRSREEAGVDIEPSNTALEILNNDDIAQLLASDRVKQFVGVIVDQTTKNLREDLKAEVREEVRNEMRIELKELHEKMDQIHENQEARDKELVKTMRTLMEQKKKGIFSRLFGK